MPTVKTVLRQLSDIDVGFISLVDRGANRIPFRIVKRHADGTQQEQPMSLDLAKLGIRKKETPAPGPTVTALVLKNSTEEFATEMQTLLKAEGLEFTHLIKGDDGTFTLAVDEAFDKGATAVECGTDAVAILKAFDPYCTPLKDMSFGEAATARGFYSSIDSASRTYSDAVYTALYEAANPQDATTSIKKLSGEFTTFVTTMVAGLPAKVFKMDKVLKHAKGKMKDKAKEEEDAKAEKEKSAAMKKAEEDAAAALAASTAAAAEAAKALEKPADGTQVEKTDPVPAPTPEIAALIAAVQGLTASVQKSAESQAKTAEAVAALQEGQKALETSVQKFDTAARSADSALQVLKNTVVGSDTGGEQQVQTTAVVKKSDDPFTGQFDTAFLPRRR